MTQFLNDCPPEPEPECTCRVWLGGDGENEYDTDGCPLHSEDDNTDYCGLCGEPGADKMAKWTGGGVYWPGECEPDSECVHSECEQEECERAFLCLSEEQRQATLDSLRD